MSVTAAYTIIQWVPVLPPSSITIDGVESCMVRDSSIVKLTFRTQADKDAYPALLKQSIERHGGQLSLVQEIPERYMA